jgi:hypothetical protein
VTPQFGASLSDDTRVIIYDRNMFIIQATDFVLLAKVCPWTGYLTLLITLLEICGSSFL